MTASGNRRAFLAAAVGGASALAGCLSMLPAVDSDRPLPSVPTGAWTQYGANGANTFTSGCVAPSEGNLAWTSAAFTRFQPAVADGVVYMTNFDPSHEGSVIALDAQNGTEQWRRTLNASGENAIAIVADHCLVGYDAELVALDATTGERRWTRSTNGFEQLVADDASGTVLVVSNTSIAAFGAADGERRWETDTLRPVHAPAIDSGRVFTVGYVDEIPSLVCLAVDDGAIRWQRELSAIPESAPPVVTEEGVFCSDDRTLVVHEKDTGERERELHSFDESFGAPTTVAVTDKAVFANSAAGVLAVDSETGTKRWHRAGSVSSPVGLCVGTETVVAPIDDPEFAPGKKTITAFDRKAGATRWYYAFDPGFHNHVTSAPVLVDGAVFFTATHIDGLGALGDVPSQER